MMNFACFGPMADVLQFREFQDVFLCAKTKPDWQH
jgi:hypothetical protein